MGSSIASLAPPWSPPRLGAGPRRSVQKLTLCHALSSGSSDRHLCWSSCRRADDHSSIIGGHAGT